MTGIGGEESRSKHTAGTQSRVWRVREALLDWYAERGRELPWRRDPRPVRDPRLRGDAATDAGGAGGAALVAWLERWPTAAVLAAAPTGEVIREWQGLGYNRRALSLQRAARVVGVRGWPGDLTELPGGRSIHGGRGRGASPSACPYYRWT